MQPSTTNLPSVLWALVASTLLIHPCVAADDAPISWYVNPMLQYYKLNSDRISQENFGYQLGIGFDLPRDWYIPGPQQWSAEFDFSRESSNFKHSAGTQKFNGYALDLIARYLPDKVVHPFIVFGMGEIDDDISGAPEARDTFHTWLAEIGGGLLADLAEFKTSRMQLRAEAKYRVEWANPSVYGPKNPGDFIFGLGVQFKFGVAAKPQTVEGAALPYSQPPARAPAPAPTPANSSPPTPTAPSISDIRLLGVNFATNSAELIQESDRILMNLSLQLKHFPNLAIQIRGYTDNRGSDTYNRNLSQRRADTVMRFLRDSGLTNSMTAIGFGEADPIADNATKAGQLANRRVILRLTDLGSIGQH